MIKILLIVTALLLTTCLSAKADLMIVQAVETEKNGQHETANITIQFKGDLMRVDMDLRMSSVMNLKTGDMMTIMHDQKMLMRVDGQHLESIKPLVAQQLSQNAPTDAPLTATGNHQKINGYNTSEYLQKTSSGEIHYWIAEDYPNYKTLLAEIQKLQSGKLGQLSGQAMTDLTSLPGLPLKTVIIADGSTTTSTIQSIEEKTIDASAFEPPAGYNEVQLPGLGALPHTSDSTV